MKRFFYTWALFLAIGADLFSQVDSSALPEPPVPTFRTQQLIFGQSVETLWAHHLSMVITHRFSGAVDQGISSFFGLDQFADFRLGLAYGLSDELTVGLGRTRVNKAYDLSAKWSGWRQRTDGWPFSLTLLGQAVVETTPWTTEQEASLRFAHRLSYLAQVLLARRCTDWLSLQIAPTWLHRNLTQRIVEPNGLAVAPVAAEFRLSSRLSLSAEYLLRFNTNGLTELSPGFGFSIDLTSARHAFQLQFSNATQVLEYRNFPGLTVPFGSAGMFFGFHVVRNFAW